MSVVLITSKIEAEVRRKFDQHVAIVRGLQALYEHERLVTAGIERFGGHCHVRVFWYDEPPVIVWVVPVSSFREAEPIIEFIEDWRPAGFALECTRTIDYESLGHRDFYFDGLRLTCNLRDDSEACRREVVGYEAPQPIYKFVCDEAAL